MFSQTSMPDLALPCFQEENQILFYSVTYHLQAACCSRLFDQPTIRKHFARQMFIPRIKPLRSLSSIAKRSRPIDVIILEGTHTIFRYIIHTCPGIYNGRSMGRVCRTMTNGRKIIDGVRLKRRWREVV